MNCQKGYLCPTLLLGVDISLIILEGEEFIGLSTLTKLFIIGIPCP